MELDQSFLSRGVNEGSHAVTVEVRVGDVVADGDRRTPEVGVAVEGHPAAAGNRDRADAIVADRRPAGLRHVEAAANTSREGHRCGVRAGNGRGCPRGLSDLGLFSARETTFQNAPPCHSSPLRL